MKPDHPILLLAVALAASACTVTTLRVPLAPPGVQVRPEVARGYEAFEGRLSTLRALGPGPRLRRPWCPEPRGHRRARRRLPALPEPRALGRVGRPHRPGFRRLAGVAE